MSSIKTVQTRFSKPYLNRVPIPTKPPIYNGIMPPGWRGLLADGFCLTDEDVWSSRLGPLSACAAQTFTGKFDAMGVVDEAIQRGPDCLGRRSRRRRRAFGTGRGLDRADCGNPRLKSSNASKARALSAFEAITKSSCLERRNRKPPGTGSTPSRFCFSAGPLGVRCRNRRSIEFP